MLDVILCKCPIVLAFVAFAGVTVILVNTLGQLLVEIDELKNETFRFRVRIGDISAQIATYKEQADTAKRNYDNLKNATVEMEQQYIIKLNALSKIIKDVHLKLLAAESNIQYSDQKLLEQTGDFNSLKDELAKNIENLTNTTDIPESELNYVD